MKSAIHPKYEKVRVICSCGNQFETRSTFQGGEIPISVCNLCHPFYTGKQKIMDTQGRVDKFYKRYGAASGTA